MNKKNLQRTIRILMRFMLPPSRTSFKNYPEDIRKRSGLYLERDRVVSWDNNGFISVFPICQIDGILPGQQIFYPYEEVGKLKAGKGSVIFDPQWKSLVFRNEHCMPLLGHPKFNWRNTLTETPGPDDHDFVEIWRPSAMDFRKYSILEWEELTPIGESYVRGVYINRINRNLIPPKNAVMSFKQWNTGDKPFLNPIHLFIDTELWAAIIPVEVV